MPSLLQREHGDQNNHGKVQKENFEAEVLVWKEKFAIFQTKDGGRPFAD